MTFPTVPHGVAGLYWRAPVAPSDWCCGWYTARLPGADVSVRHSVRCRTLYGDFSLDPTSGLQVGHEMLTVQWQGGQRRVVWPPQYADARLVYPRTT